MRPVFTPPSEVAEYRIVRLLGRGAMGQVYLAHDTLLDRPVAIKFIAADPNSTVRERFLVEARAIARLTHPNVVSVYRVGELGGRPYLVSEFVRGHSLAELAKPVSVEKGLQIGLGLCAGLKAAHASGVLHRDVKPANAILAESGDAKLLDFGLAKLVSDPLRSDDGESSQPAIPGADVISGDEATLTPEALAKSRPTSTSGRPSDVTLSAAEEAAPAEQPTPFDEPLSALREPTPVSLTKTGALVGTPRYMAPEIFAGEAATARSDVYSLGALLFELLSGRAPFVEPDLARLSVAVRLREAPLLRGLLPDHPLSDALAEVIDRCLARDPKLRYADGGELLRALQSIAVSAPPVAQAAVPARPSSSVDPNANVAHAPSTRNRWVWLSVAVLATGAGLALRWGVSPTTNRPPDFGTGPLVETPRLDLAVSPRAASFIDLRRADDLSSLPDLAPSVRSDVNVVSTPEKVQSLRRGPAASKKNSAKIQEPIVVAKPENRAAAPAPAAPVDSAPAAPPSTAPAPSKPQVDKVEIPIER